MGIIIGLLIGLIGGGAVAYYVQNILLKKKKEQIVHDAEAEGESIKKEKLLQAKEQFFKLKEDHDSYVKEKDRRLQSLEDKVKSKEKIIF